MQGRAVTGPFWLDLCALCGVCAVVGCDERTWASLLQVLRTGPAAGVFVLATLDSLTLPARNINLADLFALCTPLRFTAPDCLLWEDAELGEFAVTPDAPPPAAQMNAWRS